MLAMLLVIVMECAPNTVEMDIRMIYGVESESHAQRLSHIADQNLSNIEWHWEREGHINWFDSWQSAFYKQIVFTQLRWAMSRNWGIESQEKHLGNLRLLLKDGPLPSPFVGD